MADESPLLKVHSPLFTKLLFTPLHCCLSCTVESSPGCSLFSLILRHSPALFYIAVFMLHSYNNCLRKYPLLTNCATALLVYSVGDIAAQYIEHHSRGETEVMPSYATVSSSSSLVPPLTSFYINSARTKEMLVWSVGIYTPIAVTLYRHLDRLWPKNTTKDVICKVLAASMSNLPLVFLFFSFGIIYPRLTMLFFSSEEGEERSLQVGDIFEDISVKTRSDLLSTVSMGFAYWWPVNGFIFRFVPSALRPVGMSVFSVAWGCYLSLVQYQKDVGVAEAT